MAEAKQDQAINDQSTSTAISDPPILVHKVGSLRGKPKYLPGKGSGVKTKFRHKIRLTDERKRLILTYLRRGSFIDTAFAAAGVPASVYRGWIVTAREALSLAEQGKRLTSHRKALIVFMSDVEKAQAQFEQRMIDVVAGAAHAGTYTAALAILERRYPDRWAKREDQASTLNVNVGFSFVQVSGDAGQQTPTDARSINQAPDQPVPVSHQLTAPGSADLSPGE